MKERPHPHPALPTLRGQQRLRGALQPLAILTSALGDPTRLTLALALREGGELCVCDLAWIAGRAENLAGHHLRALRTAGLARSRRDGKIVFYSLTDRGRTLLDAHVLPAQART